MSAEFYDFSHQFRRNFEDAPVIGYKAVEFIFHVAELGIDRSGKSFGPGRGDLLTVKILKGKAVTVGTVEVFVAVFFAAETVVVDAVRIAANSERTTALPSASGAK